MCLCVCLYSVTNVFVYRSVNTWGHLASGTPFSVAISLLVVIVAIGLTHDVTALFIYDSMLVRVVFVVVLYFR